MSPVEPAKKPKNVSYEVSGPSVDVQKNPEAVEGSPSAGEGSLEQVRDILFGAQSREFDQRVHALENRLRQESVNLREELTRSLDTLRADFTKEVLQLKHHIQQEESGRAASLADVRQAIQMLGENLEGKLAQLQQQTSGQHSSLEEQITQQKSELIERHDQQMAELQLQCQEGFETLKTDKTDRAVLAEMLMDVALRLKVGPKEKSSS